MPALVEPVERPEPPQHADERTTMDAFLDYHRATLLNKCAGLSDSQLKLRSAEPSTLSLLGLIRHMTDVERNWFRRRIGGETTIGDIYASAERPDADFDDVDASDPGEMFAAYTDEVERCRAAAAGVGMDTLIGELSVRWVYAHMLEEYARHNGHADFLRERIDGATGD